MLSNVIKQMEQHTNSLDKPHRNSHIFRGLQHTLLLFILCLCFSSISMAGGRQRAEVIIPEADRASYENYGYAPAIKAGDYIYVSGVIAVASGEGTAEEQYEAGFKEALEKIGTILKIANASLDDVVKINTYHTDIDAQILAAARLRKELMSLPHPAWTAIGTTGLAIPEGLTEIEVVAYVGD